MSPPPPRALSIVSAALVVAIPARNEAARVADCIRSIAYQSVDPGARCEIVLLLNNCTDQTAATVRDMASALPLALHSFSYELPPESAHAGYARRLAMQHAAAIVAETGLLLTTDADSRVAPDWLAANLASVRQGAEVVAGRAEIDPIEAALIPEHLHDDDAKEVAYGRLIDEIVALLDPDPHDPWPRHTEHSGASIAVTPAAYHRAGGVPAIPLGEDRAFLSALRRVDARIRHAPGVRVTVSGRTEGRAAGGMADTIRRRILRQDPLVDDSLEPALEAARRAWLRAMVRVTRQAALLAPRTAAALRLSVAELEAVLALPYFGACWESIESRSPVLLRRTVARADLPREARRAERILRALRERVRIFGTADPAYTSPHAVAELA